MSIHLITHCYARTHPQYAAFLQSQLSSLYAHRPKIPTMITVCCSENDLTTMSVLDQFWGLLGHRLQISVLDESFLFRRGIGRNIHAKQTESDLVWFADADYYFGEGALESVYDQWRQAEKPLLIWPNRVLIQSSHSQGDVYWRRILENREIVQGPPAETEFKQERINHAIGGLQIAAGAYCREHGYLDNSKWMKPVDPSYGFMQTAEDVKFRKQLEQTGRAQPIPLIPSLYRFRHSEGGAKTWGQIQAENNSAK